MPEGYVITEKPEAAERQQIRRIYSGSGITLLVFLILFRFVLGKVIIVVMGQIFTPGTEEFVNAANIAGFIVTDLLQIGIILLGSRLTGIKIRSLFKTDGFTGKTLVKTYFTAQGLGYISAAFGGMLIAILTLVFGQQMTAFTSGLEQTMSQTDTLMAVIIIQSVLFAPIMEEIIFRGIILGSLSRYDRTFAIIISALMFGATHGNLQQAVYATAVGLVLGAVSLRYRSIVPAVIAHIFVNAFASVSALIMSSSGYLEAITKTMDSNNPLVILELLTPQMMISVMVLALLNIALGITAIVIIILNRKRFREFFNKATAAGKSRSFPIIITSIPWDINFAVAIFLIFIKPFIGTV
jgi:membrane protease YdiL (CAAX protease family)